MIKLEEFVKAREIVKEVILDTKLIYSEYYSNKTGNEVYLKPENMQKTGAYKIRGAYYKVSKLNDEQLSKGLVAASAGNHAQGVAFAASKKGCKATIVMPTNTPLIKVNRTKAYGADVVLSGDVYDESSDYAKKLSQEEGYTYIHPFDDYDIMTGQGTIALEILEELSDADYILCPIGGGGLCSGVAMAAKQVKPDIKIIGVEPENANCLYESIKQDKLVTLKSVSTIADGTAVRTPGEKVLPILKEFMDDVILVKDEELIVCFLDMIENHKMVVENSGLLTVAALKHLNVSGKKVVSILSGGNMDVITMSSVVQNGLINRGRIFTVSVLLPDKPGQLEQVAGLIAKLNGNVVKLEHNQFVSINRYYQVELRITIEAYGNDHKEEILKELKKEGFLPKLVKPKL